jgi:hypothetical protein
MTADRQTTDIQELSYANGTLVIVETIKKAPDGSFVLGVGVTYVERSEKPVADQKSKPKESK